MRNYATAKLGLARIASYSERHLRIPILILPIVLLGLLLVCYTVNVPFWDQWEMVPIIQHTQAGHLSWQDVWQQHNEHRTLIPNIILLLLATATHWNTIAECFASFAVAIGAFALILKTLRTTTAQHVPLLVLLFLSALWFSPVQVENWLWGWQLEWFLNVLGAVCIAYVLSTITNRDISKNNLVLLIAGGLLAQFSLGSGVLLWPIAIAMLLYRRIPFVKTAWVGCAGMLATCLYYWHYLVPGYPPKTLALHEPLGFTQYVLTYLGRPLTFVHVAVPLLGGLLLAGFIGLYGYTFLYKKQLFGQLVPWMTLGLYAIGTACITALSRLGYGVGQAYSSRYTTIAMLLVVSIVVGYWLAGPTVLQAAKIPAKHAVTTGSIVVLAALILSNAAWGVRNFRAQSRNLQNIYNCTHQAVPSQACLLSTYPYTQAGASRLIYLKQIHWGGY